MKKNEGAEACGQRAYITNNVDRRHVCAECGLINRQAAESDRRPMAKCPSCGRRLCTDCLRKTAVQHSMPVRSAEHGDITSLLFKCEGQQEYTCVRCCVDFLEQSELKEFKQQAACLGNATSLGESEGGVR